MSQEIYVKKIPKSCVGCKYFAEHRRQCNLELCLQWNEVKFKFNDCPLIDIKTHDRELVKEVCEKIIRRGYNVLYEEGEFDISDLECVVQDIKDEFRFSWTNKQDTKWQKLKEWLEEKKSRNERRLKEAPVNTEFYIRVSVQGITINKILTIMQELEGEDEQD